MVRVGYSQPTKFYFNFNRLFGYSPNVLRTAIPGEGGGKQTDEPEEGV